MVKRLFLLGLLVPGLLIIISSQPAAAGSSSGAAPECSAVLIGDRAGAISINGNRATGTFQLTGSPNCRADMSMASWQAPNGVDGQPYESQRLFDTAAAQFGPGVHTLSVAVPDCYYQVDLVRGARPTGLNGTAVYEENRLMSGLVGGNRACVAAAATPRPTPVVTPLPTATPRPAAVVTPRPTPVATPVATPLPTPTPTPVVLGKGGQPLPQTGGELAGAIGVTSMAGMAYAYMRSRQALRRPNKDK